MLNQTLSYLDNFARFPRKEGVEAVERLLSSHTELHKYERAQLGKNPFFSPSILLYSSKESEAEDERKKKQGDGQRLTRMLVCYRIVGTRGR